MLENNCEICKKEFPSLDIHHIISTSINGPNEDWNKCNICPSCHRLVHIGDIILEGKFKSTKGLILIYRKKGEPSITNTKDPDVWLLKKMEE